MKATCGARTLVAKTCPECFELLMADRFSLVGGVYRNTLCMACANRLYKDCVEKQYERTHRVAVKHRQPWTDREIQRLEEMTAEGLPVPQIALALGRSTYAIYTFRTKMRKASA